MPAKRICLEWKSKAYIRIDDLRGLFQWPEKTTLSGIDALIFPSYQ